MKESNSLSKSRLMAYLQCPRRLWLQVYRPELATEMGGGASKRLDIGTEVGVLAQKLYPDGQLVTDGDVEKGLKDTNTLLCKAPKPLFEAAFEFNNILVLADLLLPDKNGWRMVEVKSAASVKPYHIIEVV